MIWAQTARGLSEAAPGLRGTCPGCAAAVIPKCGSLVCWHWAHVVRDCDPWSEPETIWHRDWKRYGYQTEVVMRRGTDTHRADLVTITGLVVELQSSFLAVDQVQAREQFYGRMWWLYRATWIDRLHFGKWGFWWKHGAKSMAAHRAPVYWDCETAIWRVSLGLNEYGTRVLGKVLETLTRRDFIRAIDHRDHEAEFCASTEAALCQRP